MTPLTELIGESPGIAAVREQVAQLHQRHSDARRPPPVLVLGETGTGKGLLARAIHRSGPRAAGPFVDVNCAAIPETLLEAELFGFERGAFTDARQAKAGLFQAAHRGTIFLDEIGLLPEALQAKLLTVLEDRAVRRLGSTRSEPVDVWILTATSEDLEAAIRARRFREDLYHRLAVLVLRLPPLRERGWDVLRLAEHFLARACADYDLAPKTLASDAREALLAYRWPGNVRELANVMERVALLSEAAVVTAEMLGLPEARSAESRGSARGDGSPAPGSARPSMSRVRDDEAAVPGEADAAAERAHLLAALRETGWNVSRAAARLGISRNTLRYRMEKHGLGQADSPGGPGRVPGRDVRPELPGPVPPERGGSQPAVPAQSVAGGALAGSAPAPAAPVPAAAIPRPPAPEASGAGEAAALVLPDRAVSGRGPAAGIRWERRHVALLRADLVAAPLASAPAAAMPAAAAPADSGRALEILVEKILSFGGRVEELSPTRVVAAFGLESLEDAPRRAAHAAIAIRKAAERARRGIPGIPEVRVGLHVGQVMVARVGGIPHIEHDARREAWALLESLVAQAEAGAVLVSGGAAPFLERRFALAPAAVPDRVPAGTRRLGGLERTGLGLGGRMTRFVGRERELGVLERACEEAGRSAVRVVNVVGEAGIGKSRLAHELRRRLDGRACVFLQGHCTAFGGPVPFLPFIEVIRGAFLIGEGEGPEDVTGKLQQGLERLGLPAAENLPLLQVLLGLEAGGAAMPGPGGEAAGARMREVICLILAARCRLAPLVLVLDDLHWADTASEELLLRLVQSQEPVPLAVICAYRPPYRPPWSGRPGVTELRLEPLSEESCFSLVRDRLGTAVLPEGLVRRLVEKAEGNPLFAEELTSYLLESVCPRRPGAGVPAGAGEAAGTADAGAAARTAGAGAAAGIANTGTAARTDSGAPLRADIDGAVPAGGDPAVPIPGTLESLLMARVERLGEGTRTALQVASVIGRRFPHELLRAVVGRNSDLVQHLRDLEAQELIVREVAEGREEYRFRHVLVQDAVYKSLPASSREALHQRVGEAIEWLYATRLSEWVEVLAQHYSRTPLVDRTVRYLALAGRRSLRVSSLEEAHGRFRRAVELIETVAGCADEAFLADVVLDWVEVYYCRKDLRGLIALAERYRRRFEALGDASRLSRLLFWLGFAHFFGMRCDLARPCFQQALALGEAVGDEAGIGHALMGLMFTYWVEPGTEPRDVVDRLGARALAVAEKLGDLYLQKQCLYCLGLHAFTSGRCAEARSLGRRLIELGRAAGATWPAATGLHVLALVDLYEERYGEALARAEEALRASPDTADRLMACTVKGAAMALMGRSREGLALLREVRREIVADDYLVLLTGIDLPYGAALVLAGEIAAGVRWIEASIRRFAATGNEAIVAVGHMILGEIYLRIAAGGERPPVRVLLKNLRFLLLAAPFAAGRARRHLGRAVRIARDLDVPAVLARSLLDLGLLCRVKRARAEARAHLEEARRIAEPLDLPGLGEKIRAALEVAS